MRIVLVNRFYAPDLSATSQMLTDLAEHLASRGDDVHVVCSRQLYDDARAQLARQSLVKGVKVHRAWSTSFGRARLSGRAVDYLSFYIGAWWALRHLVLPGSIVVAKTDPPLISVLAAQVARSRSAILVNWLQDLFPEVASALGAGLPGGRFGHWLQSTLLNMRNRSVRQASANIVLGTRMAEKVSSLGVPASAIAVIPNWSDSARVFAIPFEQNALASTWGLHGKFVVMYSGNMGRAHEFDTFIAAASLLQDRTDIVLVFVGAGARRLYVESAVAANCLKNVEFRPFQPAEQLAASLSAGHVHLISLLPQMEGLIVPSKFYGVLAAGKATIFVGDTSGELARIIVDDQVGEVFRPGDAEGLARCIANFADDRCKTERVGLRARSLFDCKYSRDRALAAWVDTLAKVSSV